MTTEVVLADDDTRAEIGKMLTDASHWAQREFPVVGSSLLDDWQAAQH